MTEQLLFLFECWWVRSYFADLSFRAAQIKPKVPAAQTSGDMTSSSISHLWKTLGLYFDEMEERTDVHSPNTPWLPSHYRCSGIWGGVNNMWPSATLSRTIIDQRPRFSFFFQLSALAWVQGSIDLHIHMSVLSDWQLILFYLGWVTHVSRIHRGLLGRNSRAALLCRIVHWSWCICMMVHSSVMINLGHVHDRDNLFAFRPSTHLSK